MNRIVIATDGSDSAREAVTFGLELAAEQQANVVFVHVAPMTDVLPTGGFGITAAIPHKLTDEDSRCLDEAVALASEYDVPSHTRLLRGDVVKEIVDQADLVGADLIVVGTRGHGALTGALLGSVSRGLLKKANRPVLIVRGARVTAPAEATA
jgi:nucleotide-binding universal stress UspA family protein